MLLKLFGGQLRDANLKIRILSSQNLTGNEANPLKSILGRQRRE